jgi:hypothetical protein
MTAAIRVKYDWTVAEFAKGLRYTRKHTRSAPVWLVAYLSGVVLLLLNLVGIALFGPKPLFVLFGLAAAYYLFLNQHISLWLETRRFHQRPDAGLVYQWDFTPSEVRAIAGDLAQSTLAWSYFAKCVETPAGFLLYSKCSDEAHWIPEHGLESPAAYAALADLLRDKIALHYAVA